MRGSRIVTSWHDYPAAILGRTERPLLSWFAQNVHPGQTWLDIGAHYGYTAIALSRLVGASGRVFAFEPALATAGYLAQTRRLNGLTQLTIVPVALGAPEDWMVHALPAVRGMVDSTQPRYGWMEMVHVARLDWLWPRLCGPSARVDGVKIDVQGMELEALRGMAGVLTEWQPKLVIEVHPGVPRPALLELLASLGYDRRATAIEPARGETEPLYLDDRSYAFVAASGADGTDPA